MGIRMKCQTCLGELDEPMYRRSTPARRAPARPRPSTFREQSSPPDIGGAHGHLRQVVTDLSISFDMTIAVHGPGAPDECFAEVCRVAPAFTRSMAVEHGLGYINGDLTFPWSMVTGPSGSALLFFGHPDADSEWSFDHVLMPLLRELRSPWQASVRTMVEFWSPDAAAVIQGATEAWPLWRLDALTHTRPRTPAVRDTLTRPRPA
jgi:hypothetical protein